MLLKTIPSDLILLIKTEPAQTTVGTGRKIKMAGNKKTKKCYQQFDHLKIFLKSNGETFNFSK